VHINELEQRVKALSAEVKRVHEVLQEADSQSKQELEAANARSRAADDARRAIVEQLHKCICGSAASVSHRSRSPRKRGSNIQTHYDRQPEAPLFEQALAVMVACRQVLAACATSLGLTVHPPEKQRQVSMAEARDIIALLSNFVCE
jgi:hypothetical protein